MTIAINVKGRNVEVTEGLRAYTEKRLQKLSKFFPNLREATVRECVDKNMHRIEVTLEGDGLLLRGEERTSDMYTSIDLVLEKLEQRVKRFKDRHSHLKRHAHDHSLRTNVAPTNDVAFEEVLPVGSEPDPDYPRIVREKKVTMKPMNEDEAAQMMELIDHDFYVFLDAPTEEVRVIYRRRDGNYGLIAPKM
jgi:putative sigma-54 modulation protein